MNKQETGNSHAGNDHRQMDRGIHFTEDSFDVIIVADQGTGEDVNQWCTGNLRYGLFYRDVVPFLLFDFGNGRIVAYAFNAWKLDREASRAWINATVTTVTLHLVEQTGDTAGAKRTVSLSPAFMSTLRSVLKKQFRWYGSEEDVNKRVQVITANFTPYAMFKRSTVYSLSDD